MSQLNTNFVSDASAVKYIIAAATGKMSSKTGSLARKRELREMLEEQDKGYEDDAFEGTPFRSKKISKATQVSIVLCFSFVQIVV